MPLGRRILVADDHEVVRMSLVQAIKQLRPQAVIREVGDYKSLREHIVKESFDLAIVDVMMPNGTLQQAIDFIRHKQKNLKVLVFSSQDEKVYAVRYLRMGANGFLNKLSPKNKIEQALNAMFQKGRFLSEEVKDTMVFQSLDSKQEMSELDPLSDRELEVAAKLVKGHPLKEISTQLNLHTSTVSTYKNRIFQKLDIRSIPQLIEILNTYN